MRADKIKLGSRHTLLSGRQQLSLFRLHNDRRLGRRLVEVLDIVEIAARGTPGAGPMTVVPHPLLDTFHVARWGTGVFSNHR